MAETNPAAEVDKLVADCRSVIDEAMTRVALRIQEYIDRMPPALQADEAMQSELNKFIGSIGMWNDGDDE